MENNQFQFVMNVPTLLAVVNGGSSLVNSELLNRGTAPQIVPRFTGFDLRHYCKSESLKLLDPVLMSNTESDVASN